jgi:tetratricopeptide (TPR) repeat protein
MNWLPKRFLFLVMAAWLTGAVNVRAQEANKTFEEANKLYEQGKYPESAEAYESLLKQGKISAALLFNLGNAWFKAGQTGKAILSYRRALELAPRDPDIQANLRFVRETVPGPRTTLDQRSRFLKLLTPNELTLLTSIALWLWFGLMIWQTIKPGARELLGRPLFFSGLIACGLLVWLVVEVQSEYTGSPAVVTASEAAVRYGPLDESQVFFNLKDGAEVRIRSSQPGWLEIEDASHRKGWLKTESVTQIDLGPKLNT